MNFDDYLKDKLKDPEYKKLFDEAGIKLNLELKFNEMLKNMGYENLCVEVLDMDEY